MDNIPIDQLSREEQINMLRKAMMQKAFGQQTPIEETEEYKQAELAAQQQREGNQTAQLANIFSTMAENVTGARKGHRLGMQEDAINKLRALQAQSGKSGQDSLAALRALYNMENVRDMAASKERGIQGRHERGAEQRDISLGQTQQKIGQAEEKLKRPSDKQAAEVAGYADVLSHIKDIREMKKSQDTGPISGRQNELAQFLGVDDPEKTKFASAVGQNLADYIMSRSGLTVSDRERQFLERSMPGVNQKDESFDERLNLLEDWIKKKSEIRRKVLERQGKDPNKVLTPEDFEFIPNNSIKSEPAAIVPTQPSDLDNMTDEQLEAYINEGK